MKKKRGKREGRRSGRAGEQQPHDAELVASTAARQADIERRLIDAVEPLGFDVVEVKLDTRRNLRVVIDTFESEGGCQGEAPAGGQSAPDAAQAPQDTRPPTRSGPPPGVRIADCQRVSRAAAAVLEDLGHDPGGHRIEVSSPGLDRPLTRPHHFERFRGAQVTVSLRRAGDDGRRNFTGTLLGADEGRLRVHVLDREEPDAFARADVREVRLRPSLAKPPRLGKPDRPKRPRKSGRRKKG